METKMIINDRWNTRFMALAKHIATWSKDPSRRIGAVLVDENSRVIGTGYNGFPKGVEDLHERLHPEIPDDVCRDCNNIKYKMVAHAELNAILNSPINAINRGEKCTLYVYGLPPCPDCTKVIIQAGIKHVIFHAIEEEGDTDKKDWRIVFEKYSEPMFDESDVTVVEVEDPKMPAY